VISEGLFRRFVITASGLPRALLQCAEPMTAERTAATSSMAFASHINSKRSVASSSTRQRLSGPKPPTQALRRQCYMVQSYMVQIPLHGFFMPFIGACELCAIGTAQRPYAPLERVTVLANPSLSPTGPLLGQPTT